MLKGKKRNIIILLLIIAFISEVFFLGYVFFNYIPYILFEKKELDIITVIIISFLTIFSSYNFNIEIYRICKDFLCQK